MKAKPALVIILLLLCVFSSCRSSNNVTANVADTASPFVVETPDDPKNNNLKEKGYEIINNNFTKKTKVEGRSDLTLVLVLQV